MGPGQLSQFQVPPFQCLSREADSTFSLEYPLYHIHTSFLTIMMLYRVLLSCSYTFSPTRMWIPSSVQFRCSVMSDSLWPRVLQHARLPCPSWTTGSCSNLWPSSQWYHPTILSSVIPFSSCLQSFAVSGSFSLSQFFASRSKSFGVLASVSVLPMNIQDWFPLGLTDLISLQSKGLSRVFSSSRIRKHQIFGIQPSLWPNSQISMWLLEKPQFWLYGPMLAKWCLCFLIHCLGFP